MEPVELLRIATRRQRKVELEFRVSLGFLLSGIAVLVAVGLVVGIWASFGGNGLPVGPTGLTVVVAGMAEVFIVLGALFVGVKWALLRSARSGRSSRAL